MLPKKLRLDPEGFYHLGTHQPPASHLPKGGRSWWSHHPQSSSLLAASGAARFSALRTAGNDINPRYDETADDSGVVYETTTFPQVNYDLMS